MKLKMSEACHYITKPKPYPQAFGLTSFIEVERLQHGVDGHSNRSHCGHLGLQSHLVSTWQDVEVRAVSGFSLHSVATFPVLQVEMSKFSI